MFNNPSITQYSSIFFRVPGTVVGLLRPTCYKIGTDDTANTRLAKTVEYSYDYGFNYIDLFEGYIYFDSDPSGNWISRVKPDGTALELVGKQH